MPTAIKMPQLGVTMTEAKIINWLKREGEPVRKGEAVATIETDKLNTEVEATGDGILRRIVAPEGATVPVIGLMGVIAAPSDTDEAVEALISGPATRAPGPGPGAATRAATTQPAPTAAAAGPAVAASAPAPGSAVQVGSEAEVRASPIARRLASDLGVNLSSLRGSGPGGRVVESDVRAAAQAAAAAATVSAPVASPAPASNGFVRASPIARRLATEHGLSLNAIRGTGPEGRVVERDVLAAVEAMAAAPPVPAVPAAAPAGELTRRETIRLDGMRRLIAERMHASLQVGAQLTITTEADATALVELRGHLVPAARVFGHRPPTYTDLLVSIVARTLRAHPLLNSSLIGTGDAQEVALWEEINVGVAVALDRGLIVPVIRGADQKPLQTISQELGDAAERARQNRLTVDDLQHGTFTITNLGQMEVDTFTPIVNPPQCAILGVGRIAKKPAVHQDQLAIRHMVSLSLSFDHRIVDGTPAGAFLRDVKRAIEAATFGE